MAARPDGATVVAAALLYGNVMAVAVRTQGLPVSAANTVALILLLAALTVFAGPATDYMDAAAGQLYSPTSYIEAVLGTTGR